MDTNIEKVSGKKGVVIREDKYGIEVLTMRNGYQWSGMPMDAELIDMLEQAIVEFKRTQASPASAPEGWKHSCNALCLDGVELWIPQCPHCGKPAPATPVSEDRKDAERYLWLRASDFDIFGSPHAIHLSGKELDQAIDAAMYGEVK